MGVTPRKFAPGLQTCADPGSLRYVGAAISRQTARCSCCVATKSRRQCRRWVIRDRPIPRQFRPMSVVTPIATRILQCRERSDGPAADICGAANSASIRSPRRRSHAIEKSNAAQQALHRGQIDAVLGMGFVAHHLIEFSREALRGEQRLVLFRAGPRPHACSRPQRGAVATAVGLTESGQRPRRHGSVQPGITLPRSSYSPRYPTDSIIPQTWRHPPETRETR